MCSVLIFSDILQLLLIFNLNLKHFIDFKNVGQSRPLFVYFRAFIIQQSKFQFQQYKYYKAQKVCFGFEPQATGCQAQTKPRSYGGRPTFHCEHVCYTCQMPPIRHKSANLVTHWVVTASTKSSIIKQEQMSSAKVTQLC